MSNTPTIERFESYPYETIYNGKIMDSRQLSYIPHENPLPADGLPLDGFIVELRLLEANIKKEFPSAALFTFRDSGTEYDVEMNLVFVRDMNAAEQKRYDKEKARRAEAQAKALSSVEKDERAQLKKLLKKYPDAKKNG